MSLSYIPTIVIISNSFVSSFFFSSFSSLRLCAFASLRQAQDKLCVNSFASFLAHPRHIIIPVHAVIVENQVDGGFDVESGRHARGAGSGRR